MVIVYLIYGYLLAGLLVGCWFCFFQAGRTDAGAAQSGIGHPACGPLALAPGVK
jgi:hypothetical protein